MLTKEHVEMFVAKTCCYSNKRQGQGTVHYRLSMGRRIGILDQRWQILLTTMQHGPETIAFSVKACVILLNLMRMRYPAFQHNDMDDEIPTTKSHLVHGGQRQTCIMWTVFRVPIETGLRKKDSGSTRSWFGSYQDRTIWVLPWHDL